MINPLFNTAINTAVGTVVKVLVENLVSQGNTQNQVQNSLSAQVCLAGYVYFGQDNYFYVKWIDGRWFLVTSSHYELNWYEIGLPVITVLNAVPTHHCYWVPNDNMFWYHNFRDDLWFKFDSCWFKFDRSTNTWLTLDQT